MPSGAPNAPSLRARNIGKSFAGVQVLTAIDFELRAGEIHALVGENGAGKSTFAKILGGVHRPDHGTLEFEGHCVELADTAHARRLGIALILQEPMSFPDLSVAENFWIGRTDARPWSRVDRRAIEREAARWLSRLGADIDVSVPMRGLSIADQQLVEIGRALATDSRLLLMDEPTAALTPVETARLFEVVRGLRDGGCSVVFISHRLDEIRAICDTLTIFRDGRKVADAAVAEMSNEQIIAQMIGRSIPPSEPGAAVQTASAGPVLSVQGLRGPGRVADVNLEVRRGEILGIGGLVGAGRSELMRALFGIAPAVAGEIQIDGRPALIREPRDAIRAGLALVPEDRAAAGIFAPLPVEVNISAAIGRTIAPHGWIRRAAERQLAARAAADLDVRCASLDQPIEHLSGGNQQKAILARWLLRQPRLLMLDEPTRGIDVGAKLDFHRLLREYAAQGGAVLMVSSDLPELLALSDRILVMCEGRITAHLTRPQATEETVMHAAVPHARPSTTVAAMEIVA